jgi:hypothetical protein
MNLKKNGKVVTSKFVGNGPSSYKKRIYRAVVSQRLRNTDVNYSYEDIASCDHFIRHNIPEDLDLL